MRRYGVISFAAALFLAAVSCPASASSASTEPIGVMSPANLVFVIEVREPDPFVLVAPAGLTSERSYIDRGRWLGATNAKPCVAQVTDAAGMSRELRWRTAHYMRC